MISDLLGKAQVSNAKRFAEDPELTKSPYFLPNSLEISFSNLNAIFPRVNQPARREFTTALISLSPKVSVVLGAYQIQSLPLLNFFFLTRVLIEKFSAFPFCRRRFGREHDASMFYRA